MKLSIPKFQFNLKNLKWKNLELYEDIFPPSCFCTIHLLNEFQTDFFESCCLEIEEWKDLKKIGEYLKWNMLIISDIYYDSQYPEWDLNLEFDLNINLKNNQLLFQIYDYDELEEKTKRLRYFIFSIDYMLKYDGECKEILNNEFLNFEIMKQQDSLIKYYDLFFKNVKDQINNSYTDCIIIIKIQ